MSKFNTNTAVKNRTPNTVNLAGGTAWKQDAKLELASLVATSMVQDQYYRSADQSLDRLRELIDAVDPLFAAKTAVYVRNEDGLRSITHALAGEIAARVKGKEWTKDFYKAVVRRPDDATEILAYYTTHYGKPVPNSLKKGLGASLGKFDRYQLAKYRGGGKTVSLVDVVNICHPRPTAKNTDALAELVAGTLRSESTWEAKLSEAGKSENVEAAKTQAWSELVLERKIGYFALLKNLRNICDQAPEVVAAACELLQDEKLIANSLVLPFRYMNAFDQLRSYPQVLVALSNALDLSLSNIPDFGNALVAIDGSGSMDNRVAGGSLTYKGVGALFGAALYKKNLSDVIVFGDTSGPVNGLNPADSTLTLAERINETCYGHGTNFHSIFEYATNSGKVYDNIIIFSDMQAWRDGGWGYSDPRASFKAYKQLTGADPNVFAFDLTGYGSSQFPENKVYQMAGFSDKSIGLMEKLKVDRQALVRTIEAVKF